MSSAEEDDPVAGNEPIEVATGTTAREPTAVPTGTTTASTNPRPPVADVSPTPKRGGFHPLYKTYLGGAKLNNEYVSVVSIGTGNGIYRFSTQRRHEKTIGSIERSLQDARDSITSVKFNGKLEPSEGHLTEIGKERFLLLLERKVNEHGQQTFYFVKDSDDNIVSLFDNSHRFTLEAVIAEHERRSSADNTGYEQYDQYEFDEIELSRLVVLSLISDTFLDTIRVRFSHLDNYDSLPGSALFMMALEACNASISHDVDGARQKLDEMTLDSYPGEDITALATDAQKYIKIMQGDYALPVTTGSRLIKKLTRTSSEFFNRKMFALLDDVKIMELKYKLSDPRQLLKDSDYNKYGPLGIIATLQQAHGALLTEHEWPALAATIPQSNNASAPGQTPSTSVNVAPITPTSNEATICVRCNGAHNVRNCPSPPSGTAPAAGGNAATRTPRVRTPLAAWKYVQPPDITVGLYDESGRQWKFCTKCKCRATQRQGI